MVLNWNIFLAQLSLYKFNGSISSLVVFPIITRFELAPLSNLFAKLTPLPTTFRSNLSPAPKLPIKTELVLIPIRSG